MYHAVSVLDTLSVFMLRHFHAVDCLHFLIYVGLPACWQADIILLPWAIGVETLLLLCVSCLFAEQTDTLAQTTLITELRPTSHSVHRPQTPTRTGHQLVRLVPARMDSTACAVYDFIEASTHILRVPRSVDIGTTATMSRLLLWS